MKSCYVFIGVLGQVTVGSAMATQIESLFLHLRLYTVSLDLRSKITTLMASLQEARFATITKPSYSHSYAIASLCNLSHDFNT
jgi:hypothetical protein